MRARGLLVAACGTVLLGFVVCPPNPRDIEPQALLSAAIDAEQTSRYEARRVYQRALFGRTEHWEGWEPEPKERVSPLHGEALLSRKELVALVRSNYTPLIEGKDRIAGRTVYTLRLRPRAKRLPWKQLWVDTETFAVLAQREWDSANRMKAAMKTLEIRPAITPAARGASAAKRSSPAINRGAPGFLPGYIPEGYRLAYTEAGAGGGGRLVYTDGLFCISLAAEPCQDGSVSRIGDSDQGLVWTGSVDGLNVTVVADLPEPEIQKIARSVRKVH